MNILIIILFFLLHASCIISLIHTGSIGKKDIYCNFISLLADVNRRKISKQCE